MIRRPANLLLAILAFVAAMACITGCTDEDRGDRGVEFYRERNAEWTRMTFPEHQMGDPTPYYDARGVGHQPAYP